MPNCYFDVRVVSRREAQSTVGKAAYNTGSKLTSIVANAAYRAGEVLHDARAGMTFDYSRKDDVLHTEIIAPATAPDWALDRSQLWNAVEAFEKRKDAQLGRSFIMALPRELTYEQNIALVREYVLENFVYAGLVADIAVHTKTASDGFENPHAHVLLTMREVGENGFAPKKNPAWNHPGNVRLWRKSWEDMTNAHLEAAGRPERVSLQSYASQGIDKIPQEHMGPNAHYAEKRKKVETKPGNLNRKFKQENKKKEIIRDRNSNPFTRRAIESWHQSFYDRATRMREPERSASFTGREGQDSRMRDYPGERQVVATAENSSWFGLGGSTRLTLYYRGQEGNEYPVTDPEAAARHNAFLQKVLRDNSAGSPIRLAESVQRLQDYIGERIEQVMGYDRDLMEGVRGHDELSHGQERERER